MTLFSKLWMNLKTEPDIWFFYGFILAFPFSIRKVLIFYPIQGRFSEYSGIYLYLSDLFLAGALLSWIIILCNKYYYLSILILTPLSRLKLWIKRYPQVTPKHFLACFGLILVLWSFLSLGWSESKSLSLFRSVKLLEFYLLAIFVTYRIVPRLPVQIMFHVEHSKGGGTILKNTLKLVIFGGVVNSVLAIWQFAIQHSAGLTFLKESVLSPDLPGVAKIVFFGHKLIRAYGFLPHPNILGGFLLLSIITTIFYRQMFHVEHLSNDAPNVPRGTFVSHLGSEILKTVRYDHLITNTILAIQLIALFFTFSKSAILGLIIALVYVYISCQEECSTSSQMFHARPSEECSTWNIRRGVEHFTRQARYIRRKMGYLAKLSLFTFLLISLAISILPELSPIQNQSLEERQTLSNVPRGTIANNSIWGIGQGQLVWSMRNNQDILDWQFQPVHNVFLLIWSELGIIGLIIFVWILWKMFHVEHSERGGTFGSSQLIFQGILLGFIFVMLFDHYLWDIQQGQIMLWIVAGTLYGLYLTNLDNDVVV